MPGEEKKKVNWKNILKVTWLCILVVLFVTLHVVQWLFCGVTFISFIFPLALFLFAGIPLAWWSARKCRNWLTRASDGIDDSVLHIVTMLLLVSWIPPALLLSTNYFLADKAVWKETLPVVTRGESYSKNTTYYWVKVEKHGVRKKVELGRVLPAQPVDSVELDVKKGFLGFEFFEHPRFILRSQK